MNHGGPKVPGCVVHSAVHLDLQNVVSHGPAIPPQSRISRQRAARYCAQDTLGKIKPRLFAGMLLPARASFFGHDYRRSSACRSGEPITKASGNESPGPLGGAPGLFFYFGKSTRDISRAHAFNPSPFLLWESCWPSTNPLGSA